MTAPRMLVVDGGVPCHGTVRTPGEKSISHRSVLLGALAEGTSVVLGLSDGADVAASLAAVEAMGAGVERRADGAVVIHGGRARLHRPARPLDCGNSGTSMRLLAGLVAGFAWETELCGDDSLSSRPMDRVAEPLGLMGATVSGAGCALPAAAPGRRWRAARHRLDLQGGQRAGEVGHPPRRALGRGHDHRARGGDHPHPHRGDAGRGRRRPHRRAVGRGPHRAGAGIVAATGRPHGARRSLRLRLLRGRRLRRPGQHGRHRRRLRRPGPPGLRQRPPTHGGRPDARAGRARHRHHPGRGRRAAPEPWCRPARSPPSTRSPPWPWRPPWPSGTTVFTDVGELRGEGGRPAGRGDGHGRGLRRPGRGGGRHPGHHRRGRAAARRPLRQPGRPPHGHGGGRGRTGGGAGGAQRADRLRRRRDQLPGLRRGPRAPGQRPRRRPAPCWWPSTARPAPASPRCRRRWPRSGPRAPRHGRHVPGRGRPGPGPGHRSRRRRRRGRPGRRRHH